MSITRTISEKINEIPRGQPFTNSSLQEYGTRAAVDQALSRLARSKEIVRVARGVYVRPQRSELLGKPIMPRPEEVVRVMAEAEGTTLQVHGAEAARRLGLTTQMPTQLVFLTNGRSKTVRVGKSTVQLKHAAQNKLALAGQPAGLALVALLYLGKEHADVEIVDRIRRQLPQEEFEALLGVRSLMPGWLNNLFHKYVQQEFVN